MAGDGRDDRHARAAQLLASGLTQEETAEAVGVSPRTIRRWRRSGLLSVEGEAIDADSPGTGHETGHPDTGRPQRGDASLGPDGTPPPTLTEARRRRELAAAERIELEVAERRGELVRVGVVEDLIRDSVRPLDLGLRTAHRELGPAWARRFGISEGEAFHAMRELTDELRNRLTAAVEANVKKAQEVGA